MWTSKNICYFSHYSKEGEVSKGLLYYLEEIQKCGFNIFFCTTSEKLSTTAINELRKHCSLIIQRDNTGLDFGSWSTIHKVVAQNNPNYWESLNKILIANDSVLGPLQNLKNIAEQEELNNSDFWSMTENNELGWHLQSYFICFNKPVIRSGALTSFLDQVQLYKSKQKIIYSYELGLSQSLLASGFRGRAAFPEEKIRTLAQNRTTLKYANPTIIYWDILIKDLGFPFLKRQVIRENPGNVLQYGDPKELIQSSSNHPDCFTAELLNL